jgi:hypothetical protein
MRRRRWRWVGVLLVVVIGLFFVADIVLIQYLESRGGAEIARTMSAEDATVDLGSFPFIPAFLSGERSDVGVFVRGASASGGLRVHSLDVHMETVDFPPAKMFALARSIFATRAEIKAKNPLGIIELIEGDLEVFIRRAIPLVGDVKVKASGVEVRFLKPNAEPEDPDNPDEKLLTKPARFLPRVEDRRLVLDLTSVSQLDARYRADVGRIETLIDLPQVPEGLTSSVSLRKGVISVESQGAEVTLDVGQGA